MCRLTRVLVSRERKAHLLPAPHWRSGDGNVTAGLAHATNASNSTARILRVTLSPRVEQSWCEYTIGAEGVLDGPAVADGHGSFAYVHSTAALVRASGQSETMPALPQNNELQLI